MAIVPGRRVAVFIDYQNCYGIARRSFCDDSDPGIRGHLLPRALAHFLAGKAGGSYELVYCGVYCGIASSEREPPDVRCSPQTSCRLGEVGRDCRNAAPEVPRTG